MKKSKIICTLGPASSSVKVMKKLISEGMSSARINMSHGSHEYAQMLIDNFNKARQQSKQPVSLLIDTKGPEIRISTFKNESVMLKKGQLFTLTNNEVEGDETKVTIKYKHLINQVKIGRKIFANNGLVILKVTALTDTDIICKVCFGGKLSNNKALNVPKVVPIGDFLSENDKKDILFAIKNKANYIAASFVSSEKDVQAVKTFLKENNAENIKIISKIENYSGVKNLEKIISQSDGVMVARGDLGVEIPLEKIPQIQKKASQVCHKYGKIVIIATEMLESMTGSLRPTRAEVSDVATAIYEKVNATMLSGESAVGISPENATGVMSKIQQESEKSINYNSDFYKNEFSTMSITDAVSHSVCTNAISLKAKLVVVFTHTGQSASLLSRYRISTPILALTPFDEVYNTLPLYWNTHAYKLDEYNFETEDQMQSFAKNLAKKLKLVKKGDIMIVQHGRPQQKGTTDMLKVLVVD